MSVLSPYGSSSLTPKPNHGRYHFKLGNPKHSLRITNRICSIKVVRFSDPDARPHTFLRLAGSVILFLGYGFHFCSSASALPPVIARQNNLIQEEEKNNVKEMEDEDWNDAFDKWKSKTYALTVPLRIVCLQGSIPPSWFKDYMRTQGRRLKLQTNFYASLEKIFSQLSMPFSSKGRVKSTSLAAADMVTIGDSWLSFAIKRGLIEPIRGVEEQDWFNCLSGQWKTYLRRNNIGDIDPEGEIWAAPFRWGCMVIAYKKNKFQKHKLAPIEDWADLWRPELAGRISMVNSPREVMGAVLKYMGASYNTSNIELQVVGGKTAVQQNLTLLQKQVRLFDSRNYIKAFGVGDVWVAVGWSSDILPAAKRMSNVAVIVPKSGTSLWADLWAIPAASKFEREQQIGGRARGPSPLIHQWIEFCLQRARALPFKREVIPGASPSCLENNVPADELMKGKPKLDTNLIAGVAPTEILSRCEFLEPLSDAALSDYKWLIASMHNPRPGFMYWIPNIWQKPHS